MRAPPLMNDLNVAENDLLRDVNRKSKRSVIPFDSPWRFKPLARPVPSSPEDYDFDVGLYHQLDTMFPDTPVANINGNTEDLAELREEIFDQSQGDGNTNAVTLMGDNEKVKDDGISSPEMETVSNEESSAPTNQEPEPSQHEVNTHGSLIFQPNVKFGGEQQTILQEDEKIYYSSSSDDGLNSRPAQQPIRFEWKKDAKTKKYKYDLLNQSQVRQDGRWGFGIGQRDESKLRFVKEMIQHAWSGYDTFAFGSDHIRPISQSGENWLGNDEMGLGATIVDSLSTFMLTGMTDELEKCRKWIESFNFKRDSQYDLFETIIRVVGGLLSAYDYTQDSLYLDKANDVASSLLPAFDTVLPNQRVNLKTGEPHFAAMSISLAQLGSNYLEFSYLSSKLNDPSFQKSSQKVFDFLFQNKLKNSVAPGLYPLYYDHKNGESYSDLFSVGAEGDSFYEYLLKGWLLTGRKDAALRREYDRSVDAILSYLTVPVDDSIYIARSTAHETFQELEHLTCFAGGMLALGAVSKLSEYSNRVFELAEQFTGTCYKMYSSQDSHLAPDMAEMPTFNPLRGSDGYRQRPEVVESIFYMWRLTHDPKYRDWAWKIANAIHDHTLVSSGGYTGFHSVSEKSPSDIQESFFLAETLKYLYLIFEDDDVLPLEGVVFNTEAHPLRVLQ
ncbi:glycoside hydrolase [Paraphysoderma sedebokerense]|nr:glycoside hydrolase [Paraphysoderma sedebokerense]